MVPLASGGIASGEQNLSGVILDFAEPLLKNAHNERSLKNMVAFAIICWDAALAPEERQEESIRNAVRILAEEAGDGPETIEQLETLAKQLVARKKALFPNDKRVVLSYEFTGEGESLKLFVTSTVKTPPATASAE